MTMYHMWRWFHYNFHNRWQLSCPEKYWEKWIGIGSGIERKWIGIEIKWIGIEFWLGKGIGIDIPMKREIGIGIYWQELTPSLFMVNCIHVPLKPIFDYLQMAYISTKWLTGYYSVCKINMSKRFVLWTCHILCVKM